MRTSSRIATQVELRSNADSIVLTGKPIVYNSWSLPIRGLFRERILPGAFDKCLAKQPDIRCIRDHKGEWILGRVSSGTLRLIPQPDGIAVECDAPKTTYGLDLVESVRRGDIRGMSFEFDVIKDDWYVEDGQRCRDIIEADLYEVSYLADPAYPATEAGIRQRVQDEAEGRIRATDIELAWRRFKLLTLK